LIQPSFMFMVGVAMPFSIAARIAKGQTFGKLFLHAIWRALLLTWLGVFLRSIGRPQAYYTFEDVLSQIGMGYVFLFLLAWTKWRTQLVAALAILIGYWAWFAFTPVQPPPDNHQEWAYYTGFAAHWNKNTNPAHWFDVWFLNLFPREKPFVFNGGGYLTLSFVPSLATMIFGLLAGEWLRCDKTPTRKIQGLWATGAALLVLGFLLDRAGVAPVVKRIWSPGWVVFSTGWTCLLLGTFYAIIDYKGWKRWAFPFVIVGMNSIAMYVMAHTIDSFVEKNIPVHLGRGIYEMFGKVYAPMIAQATVLFVLWLICYWMYRRKIFLRI
jgi:heparan-alpha-glucosaminide N-acetyltransferase